MIHRCMQADLQSSMLEKPLPRNIGIYLQSMNCDAGSKESTRMMIETL